MSLQSSIAFIEKERKNLPSAESVNTERGGWTLDAKKKYRPQKVPKKRSRKKARKQGEGREKALGAWDALQTNYQNGKARSRRAREQISSRPKEPIEESPKEGKKSKSSLAPKPLLLFQRVSERSILRG